MQSRLAGQVGFEPTTNDLTGHCSRLAPTDWSYRADIVMLSGQGLNL